MLESQRADALGAQGVWRPLVNQADLGATPAAERRAVAVLGAAEADRDPALIAAARNSR